MKPFDTLREITNSAGRLLSVEEIQLKDDEIARPFVTGIVLCFERWNAYILAQADDDSIVVTLEPYKLGEADVLVFRDGTNSLGTSLRLWLPLGVVPYKPTGLHGRTSTGICYEARVNSHRTGRHGFPDFCLLPSQHITSICRCKRPRVMSVATKRG